MNDLNFFYVDTNKESDAGVKKAIFSAAAIVGAGIIVTLSFNTFGIYRAEKSISDLNNKINEEAFVESYKESLEVATERKTFSTYNSKLNEIFKKNREHQGRAVDLIFTRGVSYMVVSVFYGFCMYIRIM